MNQTNSQPSDFSNIPLLWLRMISGSGFFSVGPLLLIVANFNDLQPDFLGVYLPVCILLRVKLDVSPLLIAIDLILIARANLVLKMLRNRVSSQFFMNFVLPIRIVR
jgi:hypothetical protein